MSLPLDAFVGSFTQFSNSDISFQSSASGLQRAAQLPMEDYNRLRFSLRQVFSKNVRIYVCEYTGNSDRIDRIYEIFFHFSIHFISLGSCPPSEQKNSVFPFVYLHRSSKRCLTPFSYPVILLVIPGYYSLIIKYEG